MCASHPLRRTDQEPLKSELGRLWSAKELAPGPWLVFTYRWAGRMWFVYWLSPYVRRGLALIVERTRIRSAVAGLR